MLVTKCSDYMFFLFFFLLTDRSPALHAFLHLELYSHITYFPYYSLSNNFEHYWQRKSIQAAVLGVLMKPIPLGYIQTDGHSRKEERGGVQKKQLICDGSVINEGCEPHWR